ncbi:MAG: 6-phosphofructokinase, partial [Acidimicrobiia bacterium]
MRIGILTGGGDVPGLNPCIKAVVNRVAHEGHEVVGLKRGWGGLLYTNPQDATSIEKNSLELTPANVRTVDRSGGTFLHTSRTNPGRVRRDEVPAFLGAPPDGDGPFDYTSHALKVLEALDIDV